MGRRILETSAAWEFVPERRPSAWFRESRVPDVSSAVELPHCWNTRDTFVEGVVYRQGWGSYRRRLEIPKDWPTDGCTARLRVEGFYGFGDYWLNGRRQGTFDAEYLGFSASLGTMPDLLGGVDVGVRVCNAYRRAVLPGIRYPDFLLYGGLAGRAWLECIPDLHVDASSVVVRSLAEDGRTKITVACRTVNTGATLANLVLTSEVRCRDGRVCSDLGSCPVLLQPGGATDSELTLFADQLNPWDVDAPELYDVHVRLMQSGQLCDEVSARFGHRVLEFRERKGLFLNGKRLPLRGVNRHESMPGFGSALPLQVHRADAQQIKDMGLNFVRLSHYPHHPAFLDACDELGLLVYAELASWKSVGGGRWLKSAQRQLTRMIQRDRNRPSLLMWGLGNEARSLPVYRRLRELAQRVDPTRAISYAENHLYRARRKRTLGFPDVWGMNYEFDVLDQAVASSRTRNVIVTECSNAPETRRGDWGRERQQVDKLAADLAIIESRSDVAGFALWCFNDYATMRKARYRRFSGVVDAWRQPKMSAHYLQARYLNRPVLYMVADWSRSGGASQREVLIVSNCETLRVSVGGDEREFIVNAPMHSCRIPFADAPLKVEGRGPYGNCSAVVHPYAQAAMIRLARLRQEGEGAEAGKWAVFQISIHDAYGHPVLNWSGTVNVNVKGPAELQSYTTHDDVIVEGGLGVFWLRLLNGTDDVEVCAEHSELISGMSRVSARDKH